MVQIADNQRFVIWNSEDFIRSLAGIPSGEQRHTHVLLAVARSVTPWTQEASMQANGMRKKKAS